MLRRRSIRTYTNPLVTARKGLGIGVRERHLGLILLCGSFKCNYISLVLLKINWNIWFVLRAFDDRLCAPPGWPTVILLLRLRKDQLPAPLCWGFPGNLEEGCELPEASKGWAWFGFKSHRLWSQKTSKSELCLSSLLNTQLRLCASGFPSVKRVDETNTYLSGLLGGQNGHEN